MTRAFVVRACVRRQIELDSLYRGLVDAGRWSHKANVARRPRRRRVHAPASIHGNRVAAAAGKSPPFLIATLFARSLTMCSGTLGQVLYPLIESDLDAEEDEAITQLLADFGAFDRRLACHPCNHPLPSTTHVASFCSCTQALRR